MHVQALPPVVDRVIWRAARDEILAREKATPATATRSPPPAGGCR